MMNNFISIKEYKTFSYDFIKIKVITAKLIFIFLIILCIILIKLKFNIIYSNKYIVIKDNNQILLSSNIKVDDLDKITNNKYIYINDKKYKYTIIKIENIIDDNLMIEYNKIYINLNNYKLKIENNIITGNIIYAKENCFKIIYNYIFNEGRIWN